MISVISSKEGDESSHHQFEFDNVFGPDSTQEVEVHERTCGDFREAAEHLQRDTESNVSAHATRSRSPRTKSERGKNDQASDISKEPELSKSFRRGGGD